MSNSVQAGLLARVESIARSMPAKAQEDTRQFFLSLVHNLTALSPGGNLLEIGGTQPNASKPPAGVVHTVEGANAQYTIAIKNPATPQGTQIYHEISYSSLKSFTKNVVTMPPSAETNVQIPSPGGTFYFRLRSSYDKKTWSAYQLSSTSAISAGLVESSAISAGAAFNQTNFGVVNSQAAGGAALVTISGTGGLLTSYTAQKGTKQQTRPSATIVGVTPKSEQFVGWDGAQFMLKPTLAGVLADNLEPVGKVSVVSTAVPTLPTVDPIVSSGQILGYNVTSGGAGASQPYALSLATFGGGVGGTFGAQTIVAGVLVSVAPGNPGSGYAGGTTVVVSGGSGGGSSGGGTAVGGNGGRMTAV